MILGKKISLKEEAKMIAFTFASVVAVNNIKKNDKSNFDNMFPIKPNSEFYKVKDYNKLLGHKAKRDIKKGSQLKPADAKKN